MDYNTTLHEDSQTTLHYTCSLLVHFIKFYVISVSYLTSRSSNVLAVANSLCARAQGSSAFFHDPPALPGIRAAHRRTGWEVLGWITGHAWTAADPSGGLRPPPRSSLPRIKFVAKRSFVPIGVRKDEEESATREGPSLDGRPLRKERPRSSALW